MVGNAHLLMMNSNKVTIENLYLNSLEPYVIETSEFSTILKRWKTQIKNTKIHKNETNPRNS